MKKNYASRLIIGILRLTPILLFWLVSSPSLAQFPTFWKTGKTKEIKGYSILREEGEGRSTPYIYYEDTKYRLSQLQIRAESEMWEESKRMANEIGIKGSSGLLKLKIIGKTIEAGNSENFTVIVKSIEGEELFRQRLEPSVPDYKIINGVTYWNNYPSVVLPAGITPPFRVFTIDSYWNDPKTKKKTYLIQKLGEEKTLQPPISSEANNSGALKYRIGERVIITEDGQEKSVTIVNASNGRYRVEFQSNKGKTKSLTVYEREIERLDE